MHGFVNGFHWILSQLETWWTSYAKWKQSPEVCLLPDPISSDRGVGMYMCPDEGVRVWTQSVDESWASLLVLRCKSRNLGWTDWWYPVSSPLHMPCKNEHTPMIWTCPYTILRTWSQSGICQHNCAIGQRALIDSILTGYLSNLTHYVI